jgi:asparagine synthase (glutamine-hydrolysing)
MRNGTGCLLGTGLVPRRLDGASLVNYLEFGSAYHPLTLVEGVSSLGAGHSLVWEHGGVREQPYFDLTSPNRFAPRPANRKQLQEELHATLDEAVRMQIVSDVPLGVFLSGGIDSSAIVGILARSGASVDTFSIVFRESDYSEAEYSRRIAKEFGTNHHEITV